VCALARPPTSTLGLGRGLGSAAPAAGRKRLRRMLAECTYSKRAVFLSDPTSPCEQRIAVLGLRGTRLVVQSLCGLGLMGRGAL